MSFVDAREGGAHGVHCLPMPMLRLLCFVLSYALSTPTFCSLLERGCIPRWLAASLCLHFSPPFPLTLFWETIDNSHFHYLPPMHHFHSHRERQLDPCAFIQGHQQTIQRSEQIQQTNKNKGNEGRMGQSPGKGDGHTRVPAATNWPIRFIVLFPFNSSFFSRSPLCLLFFSQGASWARKGTGEDGGGDDILDIIGYFHFM